MVGGGIEDVTMMNPIEDFRAMFERRDVDLVDKAIIGMRAVVLKLVQESVNRSHYQKALECLIALRKGCVSVRPSRQLNPLELCLTRHDLT